MSVIQNLIQNGALAGRGDELKSCLGGGQSGFKWSLGRSVELSLGRHLPCFTSPKSV